MSDSINDINTSMNILKSIGSIPLGISFIENDDKGCIQIRNFTSDKIVLKIAKIQNLTVDVPQKKLKKNNWDSISKAKVKNINNSWLSIPEYNKKYAYAEINFSFDNDKNAEMILQDVKTAKKVGIYFTKKSLKWKFKIHWYGRYKDPNYTE